MLDIVRSEFPSINVIYKDKDSLTPERGTLSTEKAAKILNYKSQFSLEEGYIRYINWYKDFASKVI